MKLGKKRLIVLCGRRGYVMCGYLNLQVANKFKDRAVVVTGVSSINEALAAKVFALTNEAKAIGLNKGQPIKDVLKIIA